MGEVYQTIGQERKALAFHQQELEIYEQMNDEWAVAGEIGNLGLTHFTRGEFWMNFLTCKSKNVMNCIEFLSLLSKKSTALPTAEYTQPL